DLLRPARRVAEALPADVVGDLDQPVVCALGALAALERAVGAHEGGLGDVLGVGLVVEDGQRVAVDSVHVLPVQPLEGAVDGTRSLREQGSHRCVDTVFCSFLRFALATVLQRARLGGGYPRCLTSDDFGAILALCGAIFADTLAAGGGWKVLPTLGGDFGPPRMRTRERERGTIVCGSRRPR